MTNRQIATALMDEWHSYSDDATELRDLIATASTRKTASARRFLPGYAITARMESRSSPPSATEANMDDLRKQVAEEFESCASAPGSDPEFGELSLSQALVRRRVRYRGDMDNPIRRAAIEAFSDAWREEHRDEVNAGQRRRRAEKKASK